MTTEKELKDEIKIPFHNYNLKDWIKDSDVDGRGILFKFTDSDIPVLNDCIHQIVNEREKELIEEFEKMIDKTACDCPEFDNLKICGRCQIEKKLKELKEKEK